MRHFWVSQSRRNLQRHVRKAFRTKPYFCIIHRYKPRDLKGCRNTYLDPPSGPWNHYSDCSSGSMRYSVGQVCECHIKGGFPWTIYICLVCGCPRKAETLVSAQCASVPLQGLCWSVCCIGGQFSWLAQGHALTISQNGILYKNLRIGTSSWMSPCFSNMTASTLEGHTK